MYCDARNPPLNIAGYDPVATAGDCTYDAEAAEKAIRFFYRCLAFCKGHRAGEPFALEQWQADIVRTMFGWKRPDGRRRYREAFIEVPRKNGKALAVNTMLPTPTGWVSMGDVKVGDTLYDENGKPTRVVAVSGVMHNRPCYRVAFSDGESIVADAEHLWRVDTRNNSPALDFESKRPKGGGVAVATTAMLKDTLQYGSRGDRAHSIRVTDSLWCKQANLAVPPYALGMWLGDGHSAGMRITASHDDVHETLQNITASGMPARVAGYDTGAAPLLVIGSGRRGVKGSSPERTAMSSLGLFDHKHIPPIYLRASVEQRHELLCGLMDSDGYVSKAGQCEFTTTSRSLFNGVMELLRSLGYKPSVKCGRAMLGTKDCGPKFRVQFWADPENPPFKLKRKAWRVTERSRQRGRSMTRQIVSIDPVESVPVQCVQVDSPSQMYLAGHGMVPTHNSTLIAGIALYVLFCDGEAGAECYCAASDQKQAALVFRSASTMAQRSSLASRCKVLNTIGNQRIVYGDSFLTVIPASESGSHGFDSHLVIGDEIHAWSGREFHDVLHTSTGARTQPLEVYITTAGYDRESICYEKYTYACNVRDGITSDPNYLPVIYETGENEDWTDPAVWRKANPNLGISVFEEYLAAECEKAKKNPAYENTFRRLHLNQWTVQETRWLPMNHWRKCATTVEPLDRSQDVIGGLDLSAVADFTAWMQLHRTETGIRCHGHYFIPEERAHEYEQADGLSISRWVKDGWLTLIPGGRIDHSFIHRRIREDAEHTGVHSIGFDPWNMEQLRIDLEAEGFDMVEVRQGFPSLSGPSKELERQILGHTLDYGNDPILTWMAENAICKVDENGNVRPVKAKGKKKIDGIVALIIGIHVLQAKVPEVTGGFCIL